MSAIDAENIISWAKGRQAIYAYLSNCYLNIPTNESLIESAKMANHMMSIADTANIEDMAEGAALLKRFSDEVAQKSATLDGLLERMNMEYTSLFMLGDLSVPFYESVFLGRDASEVATIQQAVQYYFTQRGLERKGDINIPEDSIVHELDYLAQMSGLISFYVGNETKLTELITEQISFMENHLLKWVGLFDAKVRERASIEGSGYYAAISLLTKAFVEHDCMLLERLLVD